MSTCALSKAQYAACFVVSLVDWWVSGSVARQRAGRGGGGEAHHAEAEPGHFGCACAACLAREGCRTSPSARPAPSRLVP
eukprot:90373-Chlamydomonas_euryale.AAC.2